MEAVIRYKIIIHYFDAETDLKKEKETFCTNFNVTTASNGYSQVTLSMYGTDEKFLSILSYSDVFYINAEVFDKGQLN